MAVPNLTKYLEERLPAKAVVGLDPTVHSAKFVTSLLKTLTPKRIAIRPLGTVDMVAPLPSPPRPGWLAGWLGASAVIVVHCGCWNYLGHGDTNPIDKVWGADRPPAPNSQVG